MKNRGLIVLIVALGLGAFACASQSNSATNSSAPAPATAPSPAASVDELVAANEHYQKYCFTCHGEKGQGGTVKQEGTTLKVPSLREGHAKKHTDQELVKQVLNGGEGMPAFKEKFSTAEAADLVKYIRREFQTNP